MNPGANNAKPLPLRFRRIQAESVVWDGGCGEFGTVALSRSGVITPSGFEPLDEAVAFALGKHARAAEAGGRQRRNRGGAVARGRSADQTAQPAARPSLD